MQTLRKRSSPCKYKNEPSRFLGEGMTFKAKLIGILEVNEARGNKMCQDALNDLKTAIRAAGEHKQRITISIAIDGLRLRDEKSGDCLYHHPVHKISFIAQDMSDSRAFGYIFGSPDTGHRFFGIKTDKTASQVVISMRDLFQVVFELKKKEIEMAKHHIEQRQIKYGSISNVDSLHPSVKDGYESDKGKGKYPQLIKMRCSTSKSVESGGAAAKASTSEAIADLLDLEHELNSIQQGINQMDRITPSDPFGPLSKGDPFVDPFEDSFSSKMENIADAKVPPPISFKVKGRSASQGCSVESPTEMDKESNAVFGASNPSSSRLTFFSQFPSGSGGKTESDDTHWFDRETESLFNDRTNNDNAVRTTSPLTFSTPAEKPDAEQQQDEKKSPMKPDVFMELDPLGTGWMKPYVDKKDFFQELKNPPKKVLKELVTENPTVDSTMDGEKIPQKNGSTPVKEPSTPRDTFASAAKDPSPGGKFSRMDPFDDADPFEKTDPFSENFQNSIAYQSLFNGRPFDGEFPEPPRYDKSIIEEDDILFPPKYGVFSPGSVVRGSSRMPPPPEKSDTNTPISLSSITSKFRNSPSPPEEPKTLKRKNYQVLKHCAEDRVENPSKSPVQDEFFCLNRSPKYTSTYSPKAYPKTFKEKTALPKSEKSSSLWSDGFSDNNHNPPAPKPKAALFSIKPPPLPPKKQNQPGLKPPARPPSLDESNTHYDYVRNQEERNHLHEPGSPKSGAPRVKPELRKQSSERSGFPLLPPPPQRRVSADKATENKTQSEARGKESVLNITLNKLDSTGLENLAETLGIPSDHIYNMTLQELTKRLSQKYLNAAESRSTETFHADFESNFEKVGNISTTVAPYDKYAVFKELIESDNKNKLSSDSGSQIKEENVHGVGRTFDKSECNSPSTVMPEEDRYAALRQLSMNPQKCENLSEDLELSVEEDSSNRADNMSDSLRPKTDDSFTPMNSVDMAADSPIIKSADNWSGQVLVERKEMIDAEHGAVLDADPTKTEFGDPKNLRETSSEEKREEQQEKEDEHMDNWATFDQAPLFEASVQASAAAETFDDNECENSPFSSDGKDDSFSWRKRKSAGRGRSEVPWRDEDESWDDYSPKESYWSDESSHDDRSPDKKREGRYHRRAWNKHVKKGKGVSEEWSRRGKWNEDTEDEYEHSRRSHRYRRDAYDPADGKGDACPLNCCEGYEWYHSRSEPWNESDKYLRCYVERRKRSESDDEYRRRCDSDTSDKEYVWTFKRGFPDGYERAEKQQQYHMLPYSSREYAVHCHEPRSKHRKGDSHKRPSSASESKRNYEKMYAGGDHPCKGKRSAQEGDPSPVCHTDFRYCCGSESSSHHYNSYERKQLHAAQGKKSARSRRIDNGGHACEANESKGESFDYYKPSWHKTPDPSSRRTNRLFKFEDDFTPEKLTQVKLSSPKRDHSKSPKRKKQEEGSGFVRSANDNNDNFASFEDQFRASDMDKAKDEPERTHNPKQQILGKNHFAVLTRQESSASLRKSESINIFSRENDPFEGDDFFTSSPSSSNKLNRFTSEKSKSNSNVSDGAYAWKEVFGESSFHG